MPALLRFLQNLLTAHGHRAVVYNAARRIHRNNRPAAEYEVNFFFAREVGCGQEK